MTLDPLTPEQLRVAADACQRKADRLYGEGRASLADRALDLAIDMRQEANKQEGAINR
jgi:hypothetical protein